MKPIKNEHRSPPRAGSSPRDAAGAAPQWLGGDGVSPPFCVEQKKTISHLTVGGGLQATNKHQLKDEDRPPPRAGRCPRDAAGAAPQLQGGVFYKHPTVLMAGMRIFAMPWMRATVDAARAIPCPIAALYSIAMRA